MREEDNDLKMDKKHTATSIAAKLSYAVVGVAVLMLMYVCFLILQPQQVLKVNEEPLQIEPTTVMAGEPLVAKFNYCKYKDLPSNIEINFIGNVILPSLRTQQHFPLGCNTKDLKFIVPASTPTGDYSVRFAITYKTNIVHTESYEFKTKPFEVIGKP